AGILWQLYRFSKKEQLKEAAKKWTAFQTKEQFDAGTHDLGFKIYCSFGEGYELTKSQSYSKVIVNTANQLAQRFNEKVGATRSWDFNAQKWDFPVIIDNMMNLELLFEAAKLSEDEGLYDMANQHAQTTLKNHFRPDNSSFHVVDYDQTTGAVRSKVTHQGHSDDSAWARGQAWGLYGYTMAYRFTKNPDYLAQAKKIAQFIFTHSNLPADKIPYWDFNAPNIPNEERDVSAAAIATSSILELSKYDPENKAAYLKWADTVLTALSSKEYTADTNPFFLNQSVGSKPENLEVKVPIVYADYYYVEALLRRLTL
ncbi:MAG: glycoside hydrolase family 88 protein, partial [Bacteroidota bacterium]